ncbi:hypothetical protein ACIQH5_05135 [Paenarthrobacter sp. NPDC091711]|uniref:hypothetical protein n=1 Tax=Paenarthrobacter sp. NPDC091711 TaxID=3364385 RepID=UPI0038137C19
MVADPNSLSSTDLNGLAISRATSRTPWAQNFPKDLPLRLFLVAENEKVPEWLELHHSQAATVNNGTVVPLAGEHYLQHMHAAEIADGVREWESGRG